MSQTIQLFVTCLVDALQPQIGEAVVNVLRRIGLDVAFPDNQTCCGQPPFNAGMRPLARRMAEYTLQVLEAEPGAVVIPSGSCAAMIRHGYLELFAESKKWLPRAIALSERTYEFTEFLVDVMGITDLGARFDKPLTYHASCHLLRDLGVDRQPRLLLENIKGTELREMPADDCCGFGGVFSVHHPAISSAMLERKIDSVESSRAHTVVTCDTGCLMHIAGGLNKRNSSLPVMHISEILAQY